MVFSKPASAVILQEALGVDVSEGKGVCEVTSLTFILPSVSNLLVGKSLMFETLLPRHITQ